jgi:hypothetical protein
MVSKLCNKTKTFIVWFFCVFLYKHILFQKKVFALKAQTAYREDSR